MYKTKITIRKTLLIDPIDMDIVKEAHKNGYQVAFTNSVNANDTVIFDGKLDYRYDAGTAYISDEVKLLDLQSKGYGFIEYKDNIYRYITIKKIKA